LLVTPWKQYAARRHFSTPLPLHLWVVAKQSLKGH